MQKTQYIDCHYLEYQRAWDLQEKFLQENVQLKLQSPRGISPHDIPTKNYLLFCEHNHVYTLGKSGKREHLLITERECDEKDIAFFPINRGGDITYHGKGQITGYPIFDLEKFKPDIHWYMRTMEECVIKCIAEFGLKGGRIEGFSGVWLHTETDFPKKISAQGVRCSRWITMHGFAFNVNTDLSFYDYIVPCGLEGKGVTSLQAELGYTLDMEEVKAKLLTHFAAEFGLEYLP
jgi:lipoyl(octanoyl) transferase